MNSHLFATGILAGIILLALFMATIDQHRWSEHHGLMRYECKTARESH